DDTSATALAQWRYPDWTPSIASQGYICQAPMRPPTGRFLGVVFMQRLLREPPGMELSRCTEHVSSVRPNTPDGEVFEEFASYDMLALPVLDEAGRLLGAVSVDDVVDRMLGSGWRERSRPPRAAAPARGSALALPPRRHRTGGDDVKRRSDLSRPRERGRIGVSYDPEFFGQFSESIARF